MSQSMSGRLRPDDLTAAAIVLAFVGAGLLVGYVVAGGEPIPIALTLGLIAGVALLNAIPLVVWIVLVGVLVISGPIFMHFPAIEKAGWLFSLLGFFLTGAAILYPAVSRNRFARPVPSFVVLAVLLFAFGVMSLAYSGGPLGEGVRAIKRYFQFFGLLFVLAVMPFPAALIRRWWGFLVVLALLQLPLAIYQRIVLVPLREGIPRVYATDIIVGTMEGSILGGGSFGVMTMLLLFVLALLLAAHREGLLSTGRMLLAGAIVSAPMALGTATVVVVLVPLAIFAVYADLVRQRPLRFLLGGLFVVPVLLALGWLYFSMQAEAMNQPIDQRIAALIAYNFGDIPYFGTGLNRTNVYPYWFSHQGLGNPLGFLFGHGLGASFGGINESNPGHMDIAHSGMYIGLTAASSLLWDLGVVGFALYIGAMVLAARCASRLVGMAAPGLDRAFGRALYALALMLVVMFFHSNAPIAIPSHEVLFSVCLGLIAWRWRSTEPLSAGARPAAPRRPGAAGGHQFARRR